jgi:hypothetical protein
MASWLKLNIPYFIHALEHLLMQDLVDRLQESQEKTSHLLVRL